MDHICTQKNNGNEVMRSLPDTQDRLGDSDDGPVGVERVPAGDSVTRR